MQVLQVKIHVRRKDKGSMIYAKSGRLTPYAFGCGYVEQRDGLTLSALQADRQIYRVIGWRNGVRHNETYRTLSSARKAMEGKVI